MNNVLHKLFVGQIDGILLDSEKESGSIVKENTTHFCKTDTGKGHYIIFGMFMYVFEKKIIIGFSCLKMSLVKENYFH